MNNKMLVNIGSRRSPVARLAPAALGLMILAATLAGWAGDDGDKRNRRPQVPANLEPPADQKVCFHAFAVGVQIYVCTQNPTNAAQFDWVFKAPEAVLLDDEEMAEEDVVGLHYAGPTWEHKDGSRVVGAVLQRSSVPNTIPWLLLQAVAHEGQGKFARVTHIQRINTVGGTAPTIGADAAHAGQEARVPYTAEYYFYRAKRAAH